MFAGVFHRQIHQQRTGDTSCHVPVVAGFHTCTFEPQGNVFSSAAEDRDRQCVRQAYAQGANFGREQLSLHYSVDRGVTADNDQRRHDQEKRPPPRGDGVQCGQDRHGEQGAQHTEGDKDRASAYLVRQAAHQGLDTHEQEQRGSGNSGGVGDAHPDRVHQVFLHVGGVGVERQRPAHGQADNGHQLFWMTHQGAHGAFFRFGFDLFERLGLFHTATQVQRDHCAQGADHERNPPAPAIQLLFGKRLLQHDQHAQRDELARDQGHVLEAGEETATLLGRHFAEIGRRGAVLATDRQTLEQAGEDQQDRCPDADGFVAG